MDMTKEAIEKVESMAKVETFTINDRTYSTKELKLVPDTFRPQTLEIQTLTGIVDFIKANIDNLDLKKLMIIVKNHKTVCVRGVLSGITRDRDGFIDAHINDNYKEFRFGQYMDSEQFTINLMSLFKQSEARDALIKLISTIKMDSGVQVSDDGMSQAVTAKSGIALVGKVNIENPYILQPYRTFREVIQPQSPFIVRVQQVQSVPHLALFEADGGEWMNEAVQNIKAFFNVHLEGVTVIS